MLKNFGDRFKKNRERRTPAPLMPGESVDGEFEYDPLGRGDKRYDMARAYARTQEIADARRRLGLEDDDIEGSLGELDGLDEAIDQ